MPTLVVKSIHMFYEFPKTVRWKAKQFNAEVHFHSRLLSSCGYFDTHKNFEGIFMYSVSVEKTFYKISLVVSFPVS